MPPRFKSFISITAMQMPSRLMDVTDQPGRVFAVLVFGPLLILRGSHHKDATLIALGVLLILYDLFWIVFKEPKRATLAIPSVNATPHTCPYSQSSR